MFPISNGNTNYPRTLTLNFAKLSQTEQKAGSKDLPFDVSSSYAF